MFANRRKPNRLIRALIPLFTGFGKTERFLPDILLGDGEDLSSYGIDAKILSLPGHSSGSIGVLTAGKELFCGDLLENTKKPAPNSLVDDADALGASIQRLNELEIGMVYPGHGKPFLLAELKACQVKMTGEATVTVEMMGDAFPLWRCLHGGPLSPRTIDCWPADSPLPWERYRERNLKIIQKLNTVYGACAVVARHGDEIVGQLRFYPKAVWQMQGAGFLCLQQDFPAGPVDDFATFTFLPRRELADQTLKVHCLMTGSPQQLNNPFQRRGIRLCVWFKS